MFIKVLQEIQYKFELNEKISDCIRKYKDKTYVGSIQYSCLDISLGRLIIDLLDDYYKDDIISYWVYELDFGKKYKEGCFQDTCGKSIDISTIEKLYDYLQNTRKNGDKL